MVQPTPQALAVACILLSDSPEPTGPNKHPLLPAANWNKTPGNSGNGSRHSPPSALNVETVSMPSASYFGVLHFNTSDHGLWLHVTAPSHLVGRVPSAGRCDCDLLGLQKRPQHT